MNTIDRFVERLKKINIKVALVGNYPWVYLETVNGKRVKETFRGNHGFTAFFIVKDGITWSDRRTVFLKIREMCVIKDTLSQINENK
jgi:hypothetical protein